MPVADAGNLGGWSPTPLWQHLDDDDDTSQVVSQDSVNALGFAVQLDGFSDTGLDAGWRVVATARVVAGDFNSASVRVSLYQGGVEIAGATNALPSTGSWVSVGFDLTPEQAAAVTFPPNLQVNVTKLPSTSSCAIACGRAYLFVPAGFEHLDYDPATGALEVVPAGSGHHLLLGAAGSLQRVAGTEGVGALYLESGLVKARS